MLVSQSQPMGELDELHAGAEQLVNRDLVAAALGRADAGAPGRAA